MKLLRLLLLAIATLVIFGGVASAQTPTTTPTFTPVIPTPAPLFSGEKRFLLSGTSNAVVSNSVANFISVQGSSTAAAAAAEGDVLTAAPLAGHIRNLYCVLTTAGGVPTVAGGTNYVLALRDGPGGPGGNTPATTALTCTIGATAANCNDNTHDVYVAQGDVLDFVATPSGTPTALVVHCSAEYDL